MSDDYELRNKSYVHNKLCLNAGGEKKCSCGKTTNLMQHLKSWHKEDHKAAKVKEEKMRGKKESILHHFGTQK